MDVANGINLASALCGMMGTWFLFKGSFAFEAPPVWMNHGMVRTISNRNSRRAIFQRIGLTLLMISFALQALPAVLPK